MPSAPIPADALYFDFAPYMEQEPQRILRDEGVAGLNPLAILEAVGRGAERPSEIASRLGTPQSNLSRVLQLLLDTSVLVRDLPFGESVRSAKKTRYRIQAGLGSRVPSGTGRGASNSTWSRRTRTTRRASW